ncbi:hypothetical protein EV13_2881 [Prochlorococcus sp. MIT 0702]|nr:hypothetical protein EV12_2827 [Prochlorococcus sp. MIT 0701]KGG26101.1 hypothetical protein EV13_2881 [Prochlorococcus sp. MIT 0702]KGG30726.1 hypothetical protein EV14_2658 [Prochlorococcus sp. MIT 0703]
MIDLLFNLLEWLGIRHYHWGPCPEMAALRYPNEQGSYLLLQTS